MTKPKLAKYLSVALSLHEARKKKNLAAAIAVYLKCAEGCVDLAPHLREVFKKFPYILFSVSQVVIQFVVFFLHAIKTHPTPCILQSLHQYIFIRELRLDNIFNLEERMFVPFVESFESLELILVELTPGFTPALLHKVIENSCQTLKEVPFPFKF